MLYILNLYNFYFLKELIFFRENAYLNPQSELSQNSSQKYI